MKRIILFAGYIDILDIFVYQLEREFNLLGYETMIFHIRDMKKSLNQFVEFIKKPVTAMITFNNIGTDLSIVSGKNVWQQLQIPCINILMDHPFCYHESMLATPSTGIVLCVDRNHMQYLTRFYPNIPTVGYLPHGGIVCQGPKKPVKDRKMDILYCGGLSRDFANQVKPDFSQYDFDAKTVCEDAYNMLLAQPSMTTEAAIEKSLKHHNVTYTDPQLAQWIADFHVVDLYAVSHYREKTVRTLVEAGMDVTLFGVGWDNCDWIHKPNLHYKGRISADAVLEQMKDAKVVLSTMSWFKDGTHDRVFNGMLQGAVTVSDKSQYMTEEFVGEIAEDGTDCRDMILFDLEHMDDLPGLVRDLLEHEDVAQAIADRGYEKALKGHSWKCRALELANDLLAYL